MLAVGAPQKPTGSTGMGSKCTGARPARREGSAPLRSARLMTTNNEEGRATDPGLTKRGYVLIRYPSGTGPVPFGPFMRGWPGSTLQASRLPEWRTTALHRLIRADVTYCDPSALILCLREGVHFPPGWSSDDNPQWPLRPASTWREGSERGCLTRTA